jgi:hypothetical protein
MIVYFDVGENKQLRTWHIYNGSGASKVAVDLTNASSVAAVIWGSFTASSKAMTFTADATGKVQLEMDAADLTVDGRFPFRTRVTFADGTIADFPKPDYDYLQIGENA